MFGPIVWTDEDLVCPSSEGVFTDSLTPALDAFGLDGVFRIKDKQHEGLATFYRRSVGFHALLCLCHLSRNFKNMVQL